MKKYIRAAEEKEDTRLADIIDQLEDDFDYIIGGLEKLDRDGGESRQSGIQVAMEIGNQLNSITSQIADIIGGE